MKERFFNVDLSRILYQKNYIVSHVSFPSKRRQQNDSHQKDTHRERKIVNNRAAFSITLCLLQTHMCDVLDYGYFFLVPFQMLVLFLPFSSSSSLSAISLSLSILWMVFCVLHTSDTLMYVDVFVYANIVISHMSLALAACSNKIWIHKKNIVQGEKCIVMENCTIMPTIKIEIFIYLFILQRCVLMCQMVAD